MYTATADLILPTTVTGSWPRPKWFDGQLAGRSLSTCMKDVAFREKYTDALSSLVDDQQRAGLDLLTHGDYHHDDSIGGHGWHRYPLERWKGLEGDYLRVSPDLPEYRAGEILNEVFMGWRWPRVVGKIEANEKKPLEYAKIWRLAQARASKPVMFGTISAQCLPLLLEIGDDAPYNDDDRRDLIWDMTEVMNQELREVAAAGAKVIQIEDPLPHMVACFHPENTELIDFLVDAFNREVEGLDGVEIWVHTCWGNPNMQRGADNTSYANSVEIYLERMNLDVWTIEAKGSGDVEVLELLKPYKDTMKKKIAVGAVSHRTVQVESPEEVAEFTRRALDSINLENLALTSTCGFGRQGSNRMIAMYKAAALAQGANIVRRELGLEERHVPLADPDLQADGMHDPGTTRLWGGLVRD
jgi:5-methyltetrahydropteroyltriglutamate--homocysteine methyltransferase